MNREELRVWDFYFGNLMAGSVTRESMPGEIRVETLAKVADMMIKERRKRVEEPEITAEPILKRGPKPPRTR